MSRINTNVSSLVAQNALARSNADLQTALTRLSTGLRINVGKDDPAGLIASENLRRDITSIEKAVTNTERANQLIATADSALGQVSSLLTDIRGLVTEAANSGALSDEQIAANQLQVDSSLEAIDRIARVTTFQGRRILDGSLDFITANVQNLDELADLQIQQANLGTLGQVSVEIDITTAAQQATIATAFAGTVQGTTSADLSTIDSGDVSTLSFDLTDVDNAGAAAGSVTVNAVTAGTAFDGVTVNFVEDATVAANSVEASYDAGSSTITVRGNGTVDTTKLDAAFDALADFDLVVDTPTGVGADLDFADVTTTAQTAGVTASGRNAAGSFTIDTVANTAAYNGYSVVFVDDATVAAGESDISLDTTNKRIVIGIDKANTATISIADLIADFNADGDVSAIFSASAAVGADLTTASLGTDPAAATSTGSIAGGVSAGLQADVVFELGGSDGSEVFQFDSGTTGDTIADAINLVTDATGVAASFAAGTLTITSSAYGSNAVVDIEVISEGVGGVFESGFGGTIRDTGADIVATINGIQATADGNTISINTATLDLVASITAGSVATDIDFNITGGGALFQLGPNVVSNQQARLGIGSVNSATLGGISGRLYEVRTGEAKSLSNDATAAALVVDQVINKVSELRGRLGAFQRTTLESNLISLNDTLANLSDAESSIRDADFAKESASLTRAQILVQSGTAVLTIANQNPQNVLALLR